MILGFAFLITQGLIAATLAIIIVYIVRIEQDNQKRLDRVERYLWPISRNNRKDTDAPA